MRTNTAKNIQNQSGYGNNQIPDKKFTIMPEKWNKKFIITCVILSGLVVFFFIFDMLFR